MRLFSKLAFVSYIGNISPNSNLNNEFFNKSNTLHIFNTQSKNNDSDSFDDFFKEENYRNLPPEQQLERLQEDKKMYDNLQRLIAKSKQYELPKNEIVSETMYPPPSTTKSNRRSDPDSSDNYGNMENNNLYNNQKDELEIRDLYDKNYQPIRTELNSNTTIQLIPSIVQKPCNPKIKDNNNYSNFNLKNDKYFKIRDYTKEDTNKKEIYENEIYLEEINKRLKKRNKPLIQPKVKFNSDVTDDIYLEEEYSDTNKNNSNYKDTLSKEERYRMYEELNKDKRFVIELKKLKLERAMNYRKFMNHLRELRNNNLNNYYYKLPLDERGFRVFNSQDINKFTREEMQEELRNRGFRCSYDDETLRLMLKNVLIDEEMNEWHYENIVKQDLSENNINLSEYSRNKLKELKEMMEMMNETNDSDDMTIRIKRLETIVDMVDFYTDPVSYLDLDRNINQPDEEEIEKIKNAPTIYDTTFIEEMAKPITKLPDLIPRTFNMQDDFVMKYPITTIDKSHEVDELKKQYLRIEGGIHQETLPEISERFEVPLEFLGDACCRLGAFAPIDLNKELRGIISYSAIWDLLQFLNICDGGEIQLYYTHFTLKDISKELNVTMQQIYYALDKLGLKAPFSDDTKLNLTCLKALEHFIDAHYDDLEFKNQ